MGGGGVVAALVAIGAARGRGNNGSNDAADGAIIPYAGEEEHSRLPEWYTDRVESSPRQVFLLVALLFCLLTAFAKKQQNREEQLLCQIFGALALVVLTIVDIIDPISAAVIVMVSGFLASFVIVACLENSSKAHIILLSLVVLPPSLIATLANKMEPGVRIALLLSPVAWIVYKATVRAIRADMFEDTIPVKRALGGSAAVIFVSALASIAWASGFLLALGGCIVFNGCLLVIRSSENSAPVASAKVREMTTECLGLMAASMIVCNILIYASFYYKFPSIVIIPTIALILSYFAFVYLHDHIRCVMHNSQYGGWILLTVLFMIREVSSLQLSGLDVHQTDLEKLDNAAKQTRTGFVVLTSCMMFVYFMMTWLEQTDGETDSDDSESHAQAQELTPAANTAAATITRRAAAAAAAKHSTVPVAVVINRPCAERTRRAPVEPVAGVIERPCSERTCEAGTSNGASSTAVVTPRAACSASSSSAPRERAQSPTHETLLQPD